MDYERLFMDYERFFWGEMIDIQINFLGTEYYKNCRYI